jgi:hypothetical protein
MLRYGNGAALFVGIKDAGVHVQHRQLWVLRQDLASRTDSQSLAFQRIASSSSAAASTMPALSTSIREGREEDPREADHEARTARIDPIGEGAPQLIESGIANEIGEGPEAFGLQDAHID